MMLIGVLAVILRLYVRLSKNGPGLAEDDYFILSALVLGIGTAVCCLISVPYGGGNHLWSVTFEEFTRLYQTTYAFVIVYITCVSTTKVSILLFYRRVFGTGLFFYIVFTLAVLHWAEVTFTWLAGCRPISYYWRQYTDPNAIGRCIDASLFYFINGLIGMLIDVAILIVPMPTIWKLHMPFRQKILVYAILLLGSFVCVASVIRIVMMDQLVKTEDFSWAMSKVFIWSCCEPFVGIVCACLPTYAPLVRRFYSSSRRYGSSTPQYVHTKSNKKDPWSRNHGYDTSIGVDDEVELTVEVSGGEADETKHQDYEGNDRMTNIMVKKDFTWSSGV